MSAPALSRREFCEVENHRTRISKREGSGKGHSDQGHIAPLVMREVGLFACVKLARSRRVSPDVSRESTRLTVEGIRNNT
jgi:hypothetical protein